MCAVMLTSLNFALQTCLHGFNTDVDCHHLIFSDAMHNMSCGLIKHLFDVTEQALHASGQYYTVKERFKEVPSASAPRTSQQHSGRAWGLVCRCVCLAWWTWSPTVTLSQVQDCFAEVACYCGNVPAHACLQAVESSPPRSSLAASLYMLKLSAGQGLSERHFACPQCACIPY